MNSDFSGPTLRPRFKLSQQRSFSSRVPANLFIEIPSSVLRISTKYLQILSFAVDSDTEVATRYIDEAVEVALAKRFRLDTTYDRSSFRIAPIASVTGFSPRTSCGLKYCGHLIVALLVACHKRNCCINYQIRNASASQTNTRNRVG